VRGRLLRRASRIGALAVGGGFVAWSATAGATLPQQLGHVDLPTQANVHIRGVASADSVGGAVAGAGDVNGDGIADVVVGRRPIGGRGSWGTAYVVFGRATLGAVALDGLQAGGFVIDGAGWSVAGAGDVNGDGRADVIVGNPAADARGRTDSGSAYVVFGRAATHGVDLAALGEGGFRIDGDAAGAGAGWSVAGAGDVNSDGLGDVVVGAPNPHNDPNLTMRSAHVVFGKASSASVDLGALAAGGFRMDGATFAGGGSPVAGDGAGTSVAGAGDVNADGRADVVVGAPFADHVAGRPRSGAAYVVFGRATSERITLGDLGAGGFRIDGALADGAAGFSVAGAGDVDRDGRADVVVAGSGLVDGSPTSVAHVVYGKATAGSVDLAAAAARTYAIGAPEGIGAVAGAGDVNSDGRADVIVGSPGVRRDGEYGAGSAWVVFGAAQAADVDLAAVGPGGFRIDGARGQLAGGAVAGAGDVNADGHDDVLVGAPSLITHFSGTAGSAYVLFGFPTAPAPGAAVTAPRRPTCAGRAATIVARAGQRRIAGTPGRDVILGSRAGDTIDGRGGSDTICAGRGNDTVRGSSGRDVIHGGAGRDRLRGDSGDDRLLGGSGNDDLRGGSGRDRLSGNAGRDRVDGGPGNDHLDEAEHRGIGNDRLLGNVGGDTIRGNDSTRDTIDCGGGRDNAAADRADSRRRCERVRVSRRR
jgi:Ca2+-binding RTX toxin-like protein